MIRLSHVSKSFTRGKERIDAVRDVSLEINDGEIFGVIGFSGAGKSTLVRCINLLERPTSGTVEVGGLELTALSPARLREVRRGMGMIFQHFNLMPSRTVLENVIFPLQYRKIPREQMEQKARGLLRRVDLEGRAAAYPSELSGGQKQRVAIARALATDPKILLCDEATSALDPTTTQEILALLRSLNADLGLTIVVITHEMAVVKSICSRVAVMEQGRLVEQGPVLKVFSSPREKVTRDFVGAASNLSKADLLAASGTLSLRPDERLVRFSYTGPGVSEPLISTITARYGLVMNILFADVELIGDSPIGGTVGILTGPTERVEGAFAYLRERNVRVEVLQECKS
ncbi:MAG: ATP-binding cassette domain-containing protein [Succinivibrionaceae bacterium]|nr:ATP-binding cassette domain-containing protein [Succinivibrionaceae bacterium]